MKRARGTYLAIVMAVGMLALAARDTSSAPSGFSAYNIRGTYRVTFSGILLSSGQLESGIGIFIADGSGHISGTEVFSGGGKVCRDVAVTYTVGGNGIGAFSADFTSPSAGCSGHFNSALLLVDGGDVIHSVSTDTDFVTVAEEWRRQAE